jgi:4-(gamma-glutamylamino)butanal dehydrogenase
MRDLLTADDYKAIASTITFSNNAFINGGFRPARSGKTFPTINPATGHVLTQVALCEAEDVDYAVSKARESFEDGRWSLLPPAARKAVLLRLAKLLEHNRHELAVLDGASHFEFLQAVDSSSICV